jgi:hypothetical protein
VGYFYDSEIYKNQEVRDVRRARLTCAAISAAVVLGLANLSANAGQTYYRWLDDRGNPVHSDRPPPKGTDYEVVSTETSLMRQVEADEGAVPPELEPTPGNEFEQVDTAPSDVEKNPEFCQRARANLETLDKDIRIRMRDENGEYFYLTDEQKAEQRRNAEAAIAEHCD